MGRRSGSRPWQLGLAYALLLPPAILGAVLALSPWLVIGLLVVGIAWYGVTEGLRCYEEVRRADPEASLARRVPVVYASSLFVVALVFQTRFTGLLIVAGFACVDLASFWNRRRVR
jgi:hypothetical protein